MRYYFFLSLICLFLQGCLPEQKSDTGAVRVVIAERVFKIPKGYFDGRRPSGKDTESVVLEYSLPDFKVLPKHPEERAARQALLNQGLMRGMLLEAAKNRPPLKVSVEGLSRGPSFETFEGIVHGLEKYTNSVRGVRSYKPDDNYLHKSEDGEIIGYLYCSPPGEDKVPGCNHRFIDKGLIYQIHWPIRELPNWRAQKQAAIDFIDSLEVQPTPTKSEETLP